MLKSCSHVVCNTCTDELVRKTKQCTECDKELKESDITELKREGE